MGVTGSAAMASPVPPRPTLGDLYHPSGIIDARAPPPPLPHHQFYGGMMGNLHRTLDRVAAYDRVAHMHGETARQAEGGIDLALNYHPRSWRNPPVDLSELQSAASYQANNSTGSHILIGTPGVGICRPICCTTAPSDLITMCAKDTLAGLSASSAPPEYASDTPAVNSALAVALGVSSVEGRIK